MEVGETNKRENQPTVVLNPTPGTNLTISVTTFLPTLLLTSRPRMSYRNNDNDQLSPVEIPLPAGFMKSHSNLNLI